MTTYFGIREASLEDCCGLGNLVGIAQIRVPEAIKYGLTQSAIKLNKFLKEKGYAYNPDVGTIRDSKENIVLTPSIIPILRSKIREELLEDTIGIEASARYIVALLRQAIVGAEKGTVSKQFDDLIGSNFPQMVTGTRLR